MGKRLKCIDNCIKIKKVCQLSLTDFQTTISNP